MADTDQGRKNRDLYALVYVGLSAIVFAVRVVWGIVHHEYQSSGDKFYLVVCTIGLVLCGVGGTVLVVKVLRGRRFVRGRRSADLG